VLCKGGLSCIEDLLKKVRVRNYKEILLDDNVTLHVYPNGTVTSKNGFVYSHNGSDSFLQHFFSSTTTLFKVQSGVNLA